MSQSWDICHSHGPAGSLTYCTIGGTPHNLGSNPICVILDKPLLCLCLVSSPRIILAHYSQKIVCILGSHFSLCSLISLREEFLKLCLKQPLKFGQLTLPDIVNISYSEWTG